MKTLDLNEVQQRQLHIDPQGIFSGIDANDLSALEQAGEWFEADGDMIIQDGCEQNYLYLVVEGKVEVFKYNTETNKKQILATLSEGACMGEIAFIRGDVASANVKALKKTVLWRIDHSCMQQYIAEYPGGAQLCLNLADVLAQRVQEGNSRLVGVSQSLSAYFGHVARRADNKAIEAPLAAGTAEMEIPQEIYDLFVCETMEYEEGSIIGDEHRAYVDELVRTNQVDFISWLEAGQRGQKLKVILKFVQLDENGNIISHDDEEEAAVPEQPVEQTVSSAAPAYALPVQPRPRRPRGHMVSVPQVQARVKGHTAVIKEKPDRVWQIVHYGAYVLLPFVTALTILKFLPLESRAGIAQNQTYQSLPFTGIVDRVIFQTSQFSENLYVSQSDVHKGNFSVPKAGYFTFKIIFEAPLLQDTVLHLKLFNFDTLAVYKDEYVNLPAGQLEYTLHTQILPSARMQYEIKADTWNEPGTAKALFKAQGKH